VIVDIQIYERSTLVNSEKYVGLNVHQAAISVVVMDPRGKLVMESILETKAATILEFPARAGTSTIPVIAASGWARSRRPA